MTYSRKVDKEVSHLLENNIWTAVDIGALTIIFDDINSSEIWMENYPYCFGHFYPRNKHEDKVPRPSLKTLYKLSKIRKIILFLTIR